MFGSMRSTKARPRRGHAKAVQGLKTCRMNRLKMIMRHHENSRIMRRISKRDKPNSQKKAAPEYGAALKGISPHY
jgi:hypothetical protein